MVIIIFIISSFNCSEGSLSKKRSTWNSRIEKLSKMHKIAIICCMCCFLIVCVFCSSFCTVPFYPSVYNHVRVFTRVCISACCDLYSDSSDDDYQRFFGFTYFLVFWLCSLVIHLLSVLQCREVIWTLHIDLFGFFFSTSHQSTAAWAAAHSSACIPAHFPLRHWFVVALVLFPRVSVLQVELRGRVNRDELGYIWLRCEKFSLFMSRNWVRF